MRAADVLTVPAEERHPAFANTDGIINSRTNAWLGEELSSIVGR